MLLQHWNTKHVRFDKGVRVGWAARLEIVALTVLKV